MAERLDEWPRVHTCLFSWCPSKREECERCDAVCRIIAKQEPLGEPFEKVLHDNLWDLYGRSDPSRS